MTVYAVMQYDYDGGGYIQISVMEIFSAKSDAERRKMQLNKDAPSLTVTVERHEVQ